MKSTDYFLGVEVGTGSARAGIFDQRGRMAAAASRPIKQWQPAPDHVEQSSDAIWRACGAATRAALKAAGLKAARLKGIGFDATCTLVAIDANARPVSVSNHRASRAECHFLDGSLRHRAGDFPVCRGLMTCE